MGSHIGHSLSVSLVLFISSFPSSLHAVTIFTNGSFEQPQFTGSNFVPPDNWTVDTGTVFIHPNAGGLVAPDGSQQVGLGNTGTTQQISQTIGTLDASLTYRVSFYVGWRSDDPNPSSVSRSSTLTLLQGSDVFLSVTKNLDPTSGDTLGQYFPVTGTFVTGQSPDTVTPVIARVTTLTGVAGIQTFFDDFEILSATPEPSAAIPCLILTAAMPWLLRRSRKSR